MEAIFFKIVDMSLAASALILILVLFRPLLKRAPKWIGCLLWALVAVRLVCPVSIKSPFSLIPQTTAVQEMIQERGNAKRPRELAETSAKQPVQYATRDYADFAKYLGTYTSLDHQVFFYDIKDEEVVCIYETPLA